METKLTKYKLTARGQRALDKGRAITIAKNGKDPFISVPAKNLNDVSAKQLFDREDGKGKLFVQELNKTQERSSSQSQPPVAKKALEPGGEKAKK